MSRLATLRSFKRQPLPLIGILCRSDTESADVRHRDTRHFSPIKLTQFFKKNKDKVASTEDMEPKKVDDDVKAPLEGAPDRDDEPKEGLDIL
jgi:hypothetical protein